MQRSNLFVSLSAALLTLCISGAALGATTYYVSPTGADKHDGTTQATAWKTVAKVNAAALQPGDHVLFQRGGEWREALRPTASGAAGQQLVFDAYGTGAKPEFFGSDIMAKANFVPAAGGAYTYNCGVQVTYCLEDHVYIPTVAGTTVTITPTGDPRTNGKLYTMCTRGNVIFNNFKDHMVFNNLVVDETAGELADGNDQGYGIRIQGCTDIQASDCEAYRCGRHNIGIINATNFVGRRIHCGLVAPHFPGGNTAFVSYADKGAPVASCSSQWIDCIADAMPNGDLDPHGKPYTYNAYTGHGPNLGPVLLQNFQCAGGIEIQKDGGAPADNTVTVKGGSMTGLHSAIVITSPGPCLIDGMTFHGSAGVDYMGGNTTVQNCVFDLNPEGEGECGYSTAVCVRGKGENIFRFNTVLSKTFACIRFVNSGGSGQLKVYGNIFSAVNQTISIYIDSGNILTAKDLPFCDYNYYDTHSILVGPRSFTEWQALGFDTHGLMGPLLLTNPAAGDFTLQAGSMAVDAVQIPPASIPAIATDAAGHPRLQGNAYDMGAFERPAAGPVVPIISSPNGACASTTAAFSYQIIANASPKSYSATGLPTGLTCAAATGLISGTPTKTGTFNVVLSATNATGAGTLPLTLTVYAAANYPFGPAAAQIPGTIQVEDYDNGGEGVAFHDRDGTSNPEYYVLYRTGGIDFVTIAGETGLGVNSDQGGQWMKYTVEVAKAGTYTINVRAANGTTPQHFRLQMDSTIIADSMDPNTGGWQSYKVTSLPGVALTAGTHVLTLFMDGGAVNYDWIQFVPATAP